MIALRSNVILVAIESVPLSFFILDTLWIG